MKLLVAMAVSAAALGLARPQCFSEQDDFSVKINTDLSGITDFGFELYRQLAPPSSPENFFFSPYSIWTAFTLAYFGTGGETAAQLQTALRVGDKVATLRLWRALDAMYQRRQQNTSAYTFNIASRAYIDKELPIRDCISNLLHSEVERVQFAQIVPVTREINDFVSVATKGRINEIVTPDALFDAVMVLVNAAFFKGTWQYQFKPSNTFTEQFFLTPQNSLPVPMMHQVSSFRYNEFSQIAAKVLELPYTGGAMSMFILLPSEEGPRGFAKMVARLSGNNLRAATYKDNLSFKTVDVQLPKFKMEIESKEELIPALKNIGITDIFDSSKVDLTTFGPLRNVTLDKVIHKAFVEVNEEGTEAAAATALIFATRSGGPRPKPVEFHCNRPFIFLIRDNDTHSVLFMGSYKNPATASA
ncbi:leukocyte elastase inhibitor A-like [Penaeus japonicus]|uniref:leukocyte elastase inhibitor A-like n=1 Tax=Penaeus japonicus TaxID=27405 RepID=UPI001C70BE57|nr:leukocyte elastase inhibitor A-like [Penaeus japonicus]